MLVNLRKNYIYSTPEGSKTTWDKDIFDIEINIGNINPNEKTIVLNFRFVNKDNGLVSVPLGVNTSFQFDRNEKEIVKNQAEINNIFDKRQRISQLISATENMNKQLSAYKGNSGLGDDEKLKVQSDIDDNIKLIEKENAKLAALVIPEPAMEKSENFDFIVREYFDGFDLNEKGKKWIEKLVNSVLMIDSDSNVNSINKNKI